MASRTFFCLSFKFPSGLVMYFTDDFGLFALTPDIDSAVQWDKGDDAVAFLEQFKKNCEPGFLEVLNHMKVVPFGFN